MKIFFARVSFLFLFLCYALRSFAQPCVSGVVNQYTRVSSIVCNQAGVEVSDPAGFQYNDLVLLIQMQGAVCNLSNTAQFGSLTDVKGAGNYEIHRVAAVTGNTLFFQHKVVKSYEIDGRVQLIRIPEYDDVNVCNLTCKPWDGFTGGVLAIKVNGSLTLSGNVDVSGLGFRGGEKVEAPFASNHQTAYFYPPDPIISAKKGEGIAHIPVEQSAGRGRAVNGGGGGNAHNAGGGGGGGFGTGGNGGQEFSHTIPDPNTFGIGGRALNNYPDRLWMGGGGGAGHTNDNKGTSGGNGGGIALIMAQQIHANGYFIRSVGADVTGGTIHNDGQGGGGAGGTIAIQTNTVNGLLQADLQGGKGGDCIFVNAPAQKIGPGGGGAGGTLVLYNNVSGIQGLFAGGLNGVTNGNDPYGASSGNPGGMLSGTLVMAGEPSFQLAVVTPSCNHLSDGQITVTSSAATYTLAGQTNNTGVFTALDTGFYWLNLTFDAGCSVNLPVVLSSLSLIQMAQKHTICQGDSVLIAGIAYYEEGVVLTTSPAVQNGCDTLIQHEIEVQPFVYVAQNFTFCPGDTLFLGGMAFSHPLTIMDTIPSLTEACDTVRTTKFSWRALPEKNLERLICPGDSLYINGRVFKPGDIITDTVQTTVDCDTIVHTLLVALSDTYRPFLPETAVFCTDVPLDLTSPYSNTVWNGSVSGLSYQVRNTGVVVAQVRTDAGCIHRDTVRVLSCCNEQTIYVPNTFQPDSDPPNHVFRAFPKEPCALVRLQVFDRWGALLFESTDPERGWDGDYRGRPCAPGVYTWVLETAQVGDLQKQILKGSVALIR